MNYYDARQVDPTSDRPDAGKWRWTVRNDGAIWATGACSPIQTCPTCDGRSFVTHEECPTCGTKGSVEVDDSCPGHDTREEALAHQTEYELDRIRWATMSNQQQRCVAPGCDVWSDRFAEVGGMHLFVLCAEHQTREVVADLFHGAGVRMSSW